MTAAASPVPTDDGVTGVTGDAAVARRSLAQGSRSFALAGRLLSREQLDDAAAVYAYCRRADDAVDLVPPAQAPAAVAALAAELERIYAGETPHDPVLRGFADVVARRRIPAAYPRALIEGFAMDARGDTYPTLRALELYCYRVAGVVGLMMAHVLGIDDDDALRAAAHLGMAMQLTNISRDVAEDWSRGRVYVPGAAGEGLGSARVPGSLRPVFAGALRSLLRRAEMLYASGASGFLALPFRAAFAIRAAALIYRHIGVIVASRGFDVDAPRAVVSLPRKLWLVGRAFIGACAEIPRRWRRGGTHRPPERVTSFEEVAA